jgi:hypothetical protein
MADIRITGRMVNFSRLTFDTNDHNAIRQQLTSTLNEGSYLGTLVIIDSTVEQELIALIQLLIDLGLQPMAVIDGILGDEARAINFLYCLLINLYSVSKHQKSKSLLKHLKKILKLQKYKHHKNKHRLRISPRIMMRFCVLDNVWYRIKVILS